MHFSKIQFLTSRTVFIEDLKRKKNCQSTIFIFHKNNFLLFNTFHKTFDTINIKAKQRKMLAEKENYRIIMNIGDQYSDLQEDILINDSNFQTQSILCNNI
ncbi:MAG: HAD family acid phosphatase [Victivallales bacterium]|nr:HAD family acid phosphatase [Victivallales bacterium]